MILKTFGCFLIFCLVGAPLQSPAQKHDEDATAWPPPSPPAQSLHIDLKLSASSDRMRTDGEPITLRVELRNQGTEVFYASRNLDSIVTAPGYVEIEVINEKKEERLLYSLIACFVPMRADSEQWFGIWPNHYYGTSIVLDSDMRESMREPGSYVLTAKYVSHGGTVPPSPEWGVPIHWAWKGEIQSNSIKIKILPSRK